MEQNFFEFTQCFQALYEQGMPLVAITLVDIRGSAPQNLGARMLVGTSGILFGTVGGGKLEKRCLEYAQELLNQSHVKSPIFNQWNLQKDIGMTCGGVVSLLFECFSPKTRWKIAIFGAGHVSQAVTRAFLNLDCDLTVIDARQAWLDKLPKHSRLTTICCHPMEEYLQKLPDHSFVLCMTMGHGTDMPILHQALTQFNFPYVGAIGSHTKARLIRQELAGLGLASAQVEKLFCPIGEPIGNNSPAEMAISIVAQCLKIRDSITQE